MVSELRKRTPDSQVSRWVATIAPENRFLSVLTVGEIRRGIERVRGQDPRQADALGAWLSTVLVEYESRLLPVDLPVVERWGRIPARQSVPTIDALLAATALEHGLTVASRNTRDIARTGAPTVDPWGTISPG